MTAIYKHRLWHIYTLDSIAIAPSFNQAIKQLKRLERT